MTHALVVATQNRGKLDELRALLSGLDVEILTAKDVLKKDVNVVEDGATFEANAKKKAIQISNATMMLTIADDSGLEVDALGGEPGVKSARYAGEHGADGSNNALLLRNLANVPDERRTARFTCALALARPDGSIALAVQGHAHGRILHGPRGDGDFGYDPLFLFTEPGFAQTGRGFAELAPDEKALISHRGRASRELAARLRAQPIG